MTFITKSKKICRKQLDLCRLCRITILSPIFLKKKKREIFLFCERAAAICAAAPEELMQGHDISANLEFRFSMAVDARRRRSYEFTIVNFCRHARRLEYTRLTIYGMKRKPSLLQKCTWARRVSASYRAAVLPMRVLRCRFVRWESLPSGKGRHLATGIPKVVYCCALPAQPCRRYFLSAECQIFSSD